MTRRDDAGKAAGPLAVGAGGNPNAVFTKVYDFNPNDPASGYNPNGRLIFDAAGNLYGVTLYGGVDPSDDGGNGVAFMLAPASGGGYQYSVLYTFQGGPGDGARPVGGLIRDAAGNLYGTAAGGGPGWTGTVFKLTPGQPGAAYTSTTLYAFSAMPPPATTNTDGAGPSGSLVMAANGTLFGTTSSGGANGGGTVFSLTPQQGGGYTFTNLHSFAAPQDYPFDLGGLTMDAAGNLYGLNPIGGDYASGEIFGLFLSGGQTYTYQSLYSFPQIDYIRALPMGSFAIGGSGQLFGVTSEGGNNLSGTVFSYPGGSQPATPTTLCTFDDLTGPSAPDAGVIVDGAGNLFGTTSSSSPGNGAVYRLTANGDGTYSYATLFEFTEMKRQGYAPENMLVMDALGHLFGTTVEGGAYGGGVVFKIGETAQAIAVMEAGVVLQVIVTEPGRGYAAPPAVSITASPNGATAQAVATVANGSVTAVTVTNQGSGYNFGPQVIFSPPG